MTMRNAIITGGTQGIGLAIAAELSKQGISVAVGARRGDDIDVAHSVVQKISGPCFVSQLDVSDQQSIDSFLEKSRQFQGEPDILINAAGITVHQPVEGHSDHDWESVLDINLSGPFRMMRACLPGMKSRKWGRIINIASTAARVGVMTHPAYCASKAGLVGLTRAVAQEGAPHGVTCMSVSPSWCETDMLHKSTQRMALRSGDSIENVHSSISASNPQNRIIQPEEIAGIVAYCCSDAARGLTMEDIQINAGSLW